MQLIADSGATKTAWCLLGGRKPKFFETQGISPYYLDPSGVAVILETELVPLLPVKAIEQVHFYGTGCTLAPQQRQVKKGIAQALPSVPTISVASDLLGAARAVCGRQKGVACILGTGSNSCVYNGEKIVRNNPAPGYILGDEGSGAYLGKKVLQHFIYNTFDEDLMHKFKQAYATDYRTILDRVYKQPWPNRYLASFTSFLSENRGHYMIENILEDGLSDFFFYHLYKYPETWTLPIHFVGSIAWHFRDKLQEICSNLELQLGRIVQAPIEGLISFHEGD